MHIQVFWFISPYQLVKVPIKKTGQSKYKSNGLGNLKFVEQELGLLFIVVTPCVRTMVTVSVYTLSKVVLALYSGAGTILQAIN